MEPKFEYAFTIHLTLKRPVFIGSGRAAVYLESGVVEGPKLKGRVLPDSGGDWAEMRADGVLVFDARYLLEAEDGTVIYLQNRGYRWGPPEVMQRLNTGQPVDPAEYHMRVTPWFEVAAGPHDWLARHVFVGVAERTPTGNSIHYYQVL